MAYVAGVRLTQNGYCIRVGKTWLSEGRTQDEIRTVLLHEVGHILRGDCLTKSEMSKELMNIASDALINRSLDQDVVAALGGILEEDFYTPTGVVDRLPDAALPIATMLASGKLRYLRSRPPRAPMPEDQRPGIPTVAGLLGVLPEEMRIWFDRARIAVVIEDPPKTAGVFDAIPDMDDDLTEEEARKIHAISLAVSPSAYIPPPRQVPKPAPIRPVARIVNKIVRRTVRHGKTRVRRGSWRKEHRNMGYKMPGKALVPRARVLIGLDVSGSMYAYVEELVALAEASKRYLDIDIWYWATEAGRDLSKVGSGTCFGAIVSAWAEQEADLAIIITDGEVEYPPPGGWPLPPRIDAWALLLAGSCQVVPGVNWRLVTTYKGNTATSQQGNSP